MIQYLWLQLKSEYPPMILTQVDHNNQTGKHPCNMNLHAENLKVRLYDSG